eukprot:c10840_g1_i1 orf=173-409(-)
MTVPLLFFMYRTPLGKHSGSQPHEHGLPAQQTEKRKPGNNAKRLQTCAILPNIAWMEVPPLGGDNPSTEDNLWPSIVT